MTQKQFVKDILNTRRRITRNEALYRLRCNSRHITRLSAVIKTLKDEGMKIKTTVKGRLDCIYTLEDE